MREGLLHRLRWPVVSLRRFKHNSSESQASCAICPHTKEDECKVDTCMVDPCQPEPNVVIIGAGIAGLSAGARLAQCGLKKITILEAADRPGGRIHSCWLGDMIAEMGAQWIEGGCVANPVFTLAAQEGLIKAPLYRSCMDEARNLYVTSEGRAVDWPTSVTAYHTFELIKHQAASLFNLGAGRSHGTLHNFLTIRIQQELHKFPEEHRYDAARVMYGLYNTFRYRCGDDLSMVSADQFGSFCEIPGGRIRVPLGFIGVLAPLLRVLPEHSIHYCKAVQNIRWGSANSCTSMKKDKICFPPRAVINCCGGESYECDYVIVTMSLGVLKCQADVIFCPALPETKLKAIEALGFGHVGKIFLEYNHPFWVGQDSTGITLAWSQDELSDRSAWIKGLSMIEELAGSNHVLCLYISGPEAVAMERCSDLEVVEGCTQVLRRFTGDPCLPYPNSILRSKWSSDPNFQGSYSYMSVKSTVAHQCDLGAPLSGTCDESEAPIILFAGEATCPGHHGTVHGARLSGIREAERIVQLTKKHMGPPRPSPEIPC